MKPDYITAADRLAPHLSFWQCVKLAGQIIGGACVLGFMLGLTGLGLFLVVALWGAR